MDTLPASHAMKKYTLLSLLILSVGASAQTEPDELLGTLGGQYQLFDTFDVVSQAGSIWFQDVDKNVADIETLTGRMDAIDQPSGEFSNGQVLTLHDCSGDSATEQTCSAQYQTPSGGGSGGASLSDSDPVADAATADSGSGTTASRYDHVHPHSSAFDTHTSEIAANKKKIGGVDTALSETTATANANEDRLDDIDQPTGSFSNGQVLTLANCSGESSSTQSCTAQYRTPSGGGGGASLSNAKPVADALTADSGSGTAASRHDHVHPYSATFTALNSEVTALSNEVDVRVPAIKNQGDKLLRVKTDSSASEWVDEHVAVLAGLPALTGHAGNVLAVNTDADGVEWKAAGGGGEGGGISIEYTLLHTFTTPSDTTTYSYTVPNDQRAACRENDFVMIGQGSAPNSDNETPFMFLIVDSLPVMPFVEDVGRKVPSSADVSGSPEWGRRPFYWRLEKGCVKFSFKWTGNSTPAYQSAAIMLGKYTGGGGGGGGSSPSIPSPSGAGNFLKVDAAGTAYELGKDWPTPIFGAGTEDQRYPYQDKGNARSWFQAYNILSRAVFGNNTPTNKQAGQFLAVNPNIDQAGNVPLGQRHYVGIDAGTIPNAPVRIGHLFFSRSSDNSKWETNQAVTASISDSDTLVKVLDDSGVFECSWRMQFQDNTESVYLGKALTTHVPGARRVGNAEAVESWSVSVSDTWVIKEEPNSTPSTQTIRCNLHTLNGTSLTISAEADKDIPTNVIANNEANTLKGLFVDFYYIPR